MGFVFGIDTGGTYTDGVIIDSDGKIVSQSKTPTLKYDLVRTIDNCIKSINSCFIDNISLVCLSTTLATNAVVESKRCKVGLLLIGKELDGEIPADICRQLCGKIDIKGREKEQLNNAEIVESISCIQGKIDSVAISGYASVRNPSHELYVKQIVCSTLNLPVVCAHELTSGLGYYERTVTAVLNAGLVPLIKSLIDAVEIILKKRNITSPFMIVKGDGSLTQAANAVKRPIDTILSGPAASVIGGIFLTKQKETLIMDIGGTTTDIAMVSNGKVGIKEEGAWIGGWSTKLRAADIYTFGIGGDSRIYLSIDGNLKIGPQKVIPLCAAGSSYPYLINELRQMISDKNFHPGTEGDSDCFFLCRNQNNDRRSDDYSEIINLLYEGPHSLHYITKATGKEPDSMDLTRLITRGIIERSSITPTDILHVTKKYTLWDETLPRLALETLAKKMNISLTQIITILTDQMTNQLYDACMQSLAHFNKKQNGALIPKSIVAIGAPAGAWIPNLSLKFNNQVIVPKHAEVANAIGAAVGQVLEKAEALIRLERETDLYNLYAPWEYRQFNSLDEGTTYIIPMLKQYVSALAKKAGCSRVEVFEDHRDIYAGMYGDNTT
jgi:N-methylhydantoinase A/oxoprolinase/acetone carboxylase beta subunit